MAKTGQMVKREEDHTCKRQLLKELSQDAVKIMGKDLVRTRNHIKKFHLMRANIQALSLKMQVRKQPVQYWCYLHCADYEITDANGPSHEGCV